jgi:LmbE family N-acetylglucosaminyl deacetylase
LDAVFPCARDHLHFVELWRDEGLEPHKTGTILFWGTEDADTTIDISDVMNAKLKAISAHTSQMGGRSSLEIEAFIRERAQVAEGGSGNEYVEEFRKLTFRTT